jgi:hypothetical protein
VNKWHFNVRDGGWKLIRRGRFWHLIGNELSKIPSVTMGPEFMQARKDSEKYIRWREAPKRVVIGAYDLHDLNNMVGRCRQRLLSERWTRKS